MEIVKAAFTVGAFTLFSRFAGFIRELTITACLGAGVYTDAFFLAAKLASVGRRIFAEGAFSASFLPRFSKVLARDGQDKSNIFFSDVFMFLSIVIGACTVVVVIFFPSVLSVLASGFDQLSYKFQLTVYLGRTCFPYLLLMSISSLFCGILNAINKFALPAAVYSLLSIFVTVGILVGYLFRAEHETIANIAAFCVIASGITQAGILYWSLKKHGFRLKLRFNWLTAEVKDVMNNMVPGIIAAGVWQLNLLIDTTITSYLPTGSITYLNLADRLNQFPLGTLGIALSTALLPVLSTCMNKQDYDEANRQLSNGLSFAFFLTFFAVSILLALNEASVAVAFQRGSFGEEQVKTTATALTGFVIGLPAYVLTKVFSVVYFSIGDTRTPVKFGIISVIVNIIFLIILVPFLKHFGVALCTSLSAFVNAILLIYFSRKKINIKFSNEFWKHTFVQVIASVLTYCLLVKLCETYWTSNMGQYSIKWIVYITMLSVASCLFFIMNIVGLRLCNSSKWQLWEKSAWR